MWNGYMIKWKFVKRGDRVLCRASGLWMRVAHVEHLDGETRVLDDRRQHIATHPDGNGVSVKRWKYIDRFDVILGFTDGLRVSVSPYKKHLKGTKKHLAKYSEWAKERREASV